MSLSSIRKHLIASLSALAVAGVAVHAVAQPTATAPPQSPRASSPSDRATPDTSERVAPPTAAELNGKEPIVSPLRCPSPVTMTLEAPTAAGSAPAAPLLSDFPATWSVAGAQFGQTAYNKHFGHTFRFRTPGGCCQYNAGRLTVTYRALQGGSSWTSSDAGNDGAGPFRNGVALAGAYGYVWPSTGVAAGQVVTRTYSIPASWIASGRVSFAAQDDTAVVKAQLVVSGCCVAATPLAP